MTKFRLANPCQNKESKQKKHDKRDKRNAIEFRNVANLVMPFISYSAQINSDINILNCSCSAMHNYDQCHHVIGVRRKRIN